LGLFQLSVKEWLFNLQIKWLDPFTQQNLMTLDEAARLAQMMRIKKWHPAYGVTIVEPITLKDKEIEQKLAERNEARRRKDFKRADEIRAELASFGITLEDRPDGTTRWKR